MEILSFDIGSFGGTPAAHALMKDLNKSDNEQLARKLFALYHNYCVAMKDITTIPTARTRNQLLYYWYEKTVKEFDEKLAESFKEAGITPTYAHNVLRTKYRQILRTVEGLQTS